MINSMTGYGRVVKNINGKDITVELKALITDFLILTVRYLKHMAI